MAGARRDQDETHAGGGVIGLIGGAASAPFNGLGRTVGTINRDLREIAESVRVLPQLLETLRTINRRAESLDDEVREMRQAVVGIHEDVSVLTEHVDDLGRSLHPLGRIRSRMRKDDEQRSE